MYLVAKSSRCVQAGGQRYLVAANVGDARVLLSRGGVCEQLTVDHVPDDENERKRIESMNPNPKLPLVRCEPLLLTGTCLPFTGWDGLKRIRS